MSNTKYLVLRDANYGKVGQPERVYCEECYHDFDEMVDGIVTDCNSFDSELSGEVVCVIETNLVTGNTFQIKPSVLEGYVDDRNQCAKDEYEHHAEYRSPWGC